MGECGMWPQYVLEPDQKLLEDMLEKREDTCNYPVKGARLHCTLVASRIRFTCRYLLYFFYYHIITKITIYYTIYYTLYYYYYLL
jgi:hypothetical protein